MYKVNHTKINKKQKCLTKKEKYLQIEFPKILYLPVKTLSSKNVPVNTLSLSQPSPSHPLRRRLLLLRRRRRLLRRRPHHHSQTHYFYPTIPQT